MKKQLALITTLLLAFGLLAPVKAQDSAATARPGTAADLQTMLEALAKTDPIPFDSVPRNRLGRVVSVGFFSMKNFRLPPVPVNFYNLDVWPLGGGAYVVDDRNFDLDAAAQSANEEDQPLATSSLQFSGSSSAYALYGTNDLWISILGLDFTNKIADLLVHNTSDEHFYQLSSKTNLLESTWYPRNPQSGTSGTNVTEFAGEPIGDSTNLFFRAQQADWLVSVDGGGQAVEPLGTFPGQDATFNITGTPATGVTNLTTTVYYRMTGVASNDADYVSLSGMATVTNGSSTPIVIHPKADPFIEGIESVIITLIPTNTYLILGTGTADASIYDSSTELSIARIEPVLYPDAVEPDGPPGAPAVHGAFQITRSDFLGIYTNLLVRYVISGTASNSADYTFLTNQITFASGEPSTNIDINPLADHVLEGIETVSLTLYPTNAYQVSSAASNATVTIIDTTTTVSLGINSPTNALEPDGPPGAPAVPVTTFWVHRDDTRDIYTNMTVRYATSGTANNGSDYVLSGFVYFAPGSQDTNIVLTPLVDPLIEGIETVTLTLVDNTTNGYYVDTNQMTGTAAINDTSTTVSISSIVNSVEPGATPNFPGQTGRFVITRNDSRGIYTNLTVRYSVSGTASNGVDYISLTNRVAFLPGSAWLSTNIFVQPLADNFLEGDETVVLTLENGVTPDDYFIATNSPSATNILFDTVFFETVANLNRPIGIDFHAPSNSLIVSWNYDTGSPYNFARIYTNGVTIVTNWSEVNGAGNEVKLATVKANAGGFTNGDFYFGNGTNIGWVSADGTRSNLVWCVLTNATITNGVPLRGSLYVDQTGIFSNSLIAVTGDSDASPSTKSVWRVDAQAHPTLLANLNTPHLEGVITLPNDTSKWGPWAGKIITGDENQIPNPVIYTIATNGAVATYDTTAFFPGGIHCEDFDIIPTNQNLYACNFLSNSIVKLSSDYLTNYVGDLLITDDGEIAPPAKLFILHWDSVATNFVTHRIRFAVTNGLINQIEHVTFAPINLPKK